MAYNVLTTLNPNASNPLYHLFTSSGTVAMLPAAKILIATSRVTRLLEIY